MFRIVTGMNMPQAYGELLWLMRSGSVEQPSRNGPVMTMTSPVALTVYRPWERYITCPVRQANPFFHTMEFIWMMAGSRNVDWLLPFNKRMVEYTDDGHNQNAAYGYRWRRHFGTDQIAGAVEQLRANRLDRRVVLQMWDAADLGSNSKDLACNTQLLLRGTTASTLDMLVTNRSNDLIWGAMGANAVHMSYLHELIARGAGLEPGAYHLVSMNLHMYKNLPNFQQIWNSQPEHYDIYRDVYSIPLLRGAETVGEFLTDAERFVEDIQAPFSTLWFKRVAKPMYEAWHVRRREGDDVLAQQFVDRIEAPDAREACKQWIIQKTLTNKSSSTDTVVGSSATTSGELSSPRTSADTVPK